MRKLTIATLLFLTAVSTLGAAQQSSDADVPDKAEVVKFLDLMHARQQMVQVLDGMAKSMRQGAEDSFKQRVPDATPEQLAKLDKICDTILGAMPIDEMVDAIVPIYQRHLSRTDLAAISAFYSSATGQKILNEMPSILSESMQVGGEIGRKAVAAKSQELDRQMEELVRDAKKP
jgi:hypothetical protein